MNQTTAYLLYLVFTLGGAGVYFLLPRRGPSKTRIGALFCVSALAALLAVLAGSISSEEPTGYFYLFSAIAIAGATRVITHPRPVYSALYFVVVVVAVAALLVLQEAEFTAVALIIVYAGAILVTYLFVIMLAQQEGSPVYDRRAREPFMAVACSFVLTAAIAGRAGDLPESTTITAIPVSQSAVTETALWKESGNTAAIGAIIMTKYVVALELAAVLLLISMVGAIAMSRKKVPIEGPVVAQPPLGQIGREVGPW